MTKMGAREFLFLWSTAMVRGYPWPETLEKTVYNPRADYLTGYFGEPGHVGYTSFSMHVHREGSASCDILKTYGLTQEAIDAAVKKYLEVNSGEEDNQGKE